jgi:hypothetical protein
MIGWRILTAGLVFTGVSTVTAAVFGELAGRIEVRMAWISLILGALAALFTARGASAPRQKITVADVVLFAVFGVAGLRAFLWVIYPQGGEIRVLSPHNLGDMALHLNLIHRWANGGSFWPENPFLGGASFAYHPGMDLWNAVLRTVGLPVLPGLRWTGLLGTAAAAVALWRWGRGFTMAAFLFAGGLGILALLPISGFDALQQEEAWKNPFLAMFVTQRGLLYSLPAGLVLLTVWRTQLGGGDGPRLPLLAQVVLYAGMPLFNAPAFLFLSAVLAGCALAAWRGSGIRPFLSLGLASVVPASWLVRMVTADFTAPSALRFAPGWMQEGGGVWFWLWNFGLLLPLVIMLGIHLLLGGGERVARVFYAVGAGTLVFCFMFLIAPWAWDNTKLILWGWLAVAPFIWTELLARRQAWLRSVACVTLFASGAAALVTGLDARHGYKLADRAEWADAQVMLRQVPVNARLACAPGYDHPVLLLGQPVVMGYDGHLFSQGLDYAPVRGELDRLMEGREDWRDAARRLGVRYLLWGPREKALWPGSGRPWEACGPRLHASAHGDLYQLTPCLLGE